MELVRRHKNKLLLTALAAAGLYGVSRYLKRLFNERQSSEAIATLHSIRLFDQVKSTRATTASAVCNVAPRLQQALSAHLGIEELTQQLQTKPANKVELWNQLKSLSFAHLVASVYSGTLLASFMSVQLSILGGTMCRQPNTVDGNDDSHTSYLAMVEHLLGEGVAGLTEAVCGAAEEVMTTYSLKDGVTVQGLEQLLTDIQQATASLDARSRKCFLVQFALPLENLVATSEPDLSAAVRDVLESHAFAEVLVCCLNAAFSTVIEAITQSYHSASQSLTVLPLARIIPMVTDHTHMVFDGERPIVLQSVLEEQKLVKLSQNIYETFSMI